MQFRHLYHYFFISYPDCLDLHSFPTRRSSDLRRVGLRIEIDQQRPEALVRDRGGEVDRGGDRKSTRLNSSHLGISYAVFCLKKKTKEESRLPVIAAKIKQLN